MEIIKRNIVLTFDELRILLYSQGYRRCEGVYMPEKDFSEGDVIQALSKLEKSGLLSVDGAEPSVEALPLVFRDDISNESQDGNCVSTNFNANEELFYIRDDLLIMLGIIGDPKATEIIQFDPNTRLFCYFSEEGIVTSQRYPGRREYVRLAYYTVEEFEQWRREMEEEQ